MPNWFKVIGGTLGVYTSPIWGSMLIQSLGRSVNRSVAGESGIVYKINPYEFNYKPYDQYTSFEATLGHSGGYPWALMIPPYTILVFLDVVKGICAFPFHVLKEGTK